MNLQEITLYLQQNSYYGSIISMCVVVFFYILIGVLLIVISRKNGLNVCALGMIPVIQLGIPFAVLVKKHKDKKAKKAEVEITEDTEITF